MNAFMKLTATALLFASVAYAGDEEEVKDGPDLRPIVFVDEKDIENKTTVANANFGALIDRLNNALTETGIYRVLTPKDMGKGLVDDKLFQSLATDGGAESTMKTPALRIGMTLLTYGYGKASSGKDMYGNATGDRVEAKIELILKVVDMRSKLQVASKNLSRSAAGGSTVQKSNLDEQVLQEANKLVVNAIVDELVKLTPFNVLDVENGEVVVDVPSSRIKAGQQLVVYKKGKKVKNKRTGKVTAKESQVAVLGAVTLGEDSVTCKLLSGTIEADKEASEGSEYDKYIVRIPDVSAASVQSVPTAAAKVPVTPASTAVSPF